jgi:DNA (cytosine-5)-methyltransferase 1
MRKRVFVVCLNKEHYKNIFFSFDFQKIKTPTLSEFFNMNFEKKVAYTIRCGGRMSPIDDRHNWDGYYVDSKVYRLNVDDCKKLQGFDDNFQLIGPEKEKLKLLGNTIPTNLTFQIGNSIKKFF